MRFVIFLIFFYTFLQAFSDDLPCYWTGTDISYQSICLSSNCFWCGYEWNYHYEFTCYDKVNESCEHFKERNDILGTCLVFNCHQNVSKCDWNGTDANYKSTCLSKDCFWCGTQVNGTYNYNCYDPLGYSCDQLLSMHEQAADCDILACNNSSIPSFSSSILFFFLFFNFFFFFF
ncbi:hypothetical protein M0811_13665 [Anaeramoeba ignava]|uniref:Uncharacterized protein n=1 Tax=Anaeramoeba ignava TaxID=1746090 RepID=A0A9Q0L5W9_ANAIG|nr:hypothetical protein M0811_13665 [Anaeramoeba ignava]